jgi:NAD(P)-dependent dehydrogenase (short-subunit alcohol dehydrogenase family)
MNALITGGSKGLGYALAEALGGRDGARIAIVARGQVELEHAAATLAEKGVDVTAIPGDVGNKDDIHRIVGLTQARIGPIHTLIHNAGTVGPTGPMPLLGDLACEEFAHILDVNLLGPFRLTKALLGNMTLQQGPRPVRPSSHIRVVFISSDAAQNAYPQWGAYGVSKAASDHLMRAFAAENPQLSCLAFDPGEMDTELYHRAVPNADRSTLSDPRDVAQWIARELARPQQSGARLSYSEQVKR